MRLEYLPANLSISGALFKGYSIPKSVAFAHDSLIILFFISFRFQPKTRNVHFKKYSPDKRLLD